MLVVPAAVLADIEGIIRYGHERLVTVEGNEPVLAPILPEMLRTAALNALATVTADRIWPADEKLVTIVPGRGIAEVMPVTSRGKPG